MNTAPNTPTGNLLEGMEYAHEAVRLEDASHPHFSARQIAGLEADASMIFADHVFYFDLP